MSDALNSETFDLVGFLSGRDYPELEVGVYFDDNLGFAIRSLRQLQNTARLLDEEEEKRLARELADLVEEVKGAEFKVKLKGAPAKVRRNIVKKVQKDHPDKTNMFGQPQPNPEADEAYTLLAWESYVVSVTSPDGKVSVMSEALARAIYDEAPESAQEEINEAIKTLHTASQEGFEYAASEIDFLSKASPEG